MYPSILGDATFWALCLRMDVDRATQTREGGCIYCGAALHSANYRRHPRGLPAGIELEPGFDVCFSFCCGAKGCRRRHQAPSVRFLGRRVYLFAMVLLIAAMRQGVTPKRTAELKKLFGVDRRTLVRWRKWWQAAFPRSDFWREARGRLQTPVSEDHLPRSLLEWFAQQHSDPAEGVTAVLKFLCGLFSPSRAF